MSARFDLRSNLPVVIKVPALVALLMVAIGVVLTDQVLKRLAETQDRHFRELTAAYLDGLSSSVMPGVIRGDAWETFDNLDRARSLYRGLTILETVVAEPDGIVLASFDPRTVPAFAPVPKSIVDRFADANDSWLDEQAERAGVRRVLLDQGRRIGVIYTQFDVGARFKERRDVLWTLVATNIAITMLVAAVGFIAVRRMLRPVQLLTTHFRRGQSGELLCIADEDVGPPSSEFGRLFRHYNMMVRSWNEREALAARVAEEQRLTSLGRLASGMAHEINNPLGGMFNAIETLRRHGHQLGVRERALSLLERGLAGIRDVVRSALVTHRVDTAMRPLKPSDIEDLRLLIGPELDRRNLSLSWANELPGEIPVRANAVRQAALNLLLNACQASAPAGRIAFEAGLVDGSLVLTVSDEGAGLDQDRVSYLESREADAAPRPGEPGLGLWIIRRLVLEVGGSIRVEHPAGGGTAISIAIPDGSGEEQRNVA
ncbi:MULTISPECIES: HAMP domain-containing sensor histidine kinase [unclassified Bradyrhizobium]|uniref:sensor histidine kinase n=1 Tax=unclassified Bradyrhizobium TaxID=2631580 RepID=UPI0028E6BAEB|nr:MULTISPECIES: HAMP domain-containing sensor histidine kinase [unclassified Bradyrhizobium]